MPDTTNRSRWSHHIGTTQQGLDLYDATPVLDLITFYELTLSREEVAQQIGLDSAAIRRLKREGVATLDKLDRICCGLGRPDVISVHYGEAV
jgi:hypothetical protein